MDTPNYRETTISGDKWTRASQVIIYNPSPLQQLAGQLPRLEITETDVTVIGTREIIEHVATLHCTFDVANPLHLDIYTKLNELYVLLREARDAAMVA